MKESILTLTLMALIYSFGTAMNASSHIDTMSDSHIGPRLRAMVNEGRVQVLTDLATFPAASQR